MQQLSCWPSLRVGLEPLQQVRPRPLSLGWSLVPQVSVWAILAFRRELPLVPLPAVDPLGLGLVWLLLVPWWQVGWPLSPHLLQLWLEQVPRPHPQWRLRQLPWWLVGSSGLLARVPLGPSPLPCLFVPSPPLGGAPSSASLVLAPSSPPSSLVALVEAWWPPPSLAHLGSRRCACLCDHAPQPSQRENWR